MKNFFKSIKNFLQALPHFLLFELLFKLLLVAIGAPVIMLLLKLTMNAAGISYLSDESLLVYVKNPLTLLVFAVLLFCVAFLSFVELSGLATCFSCYSKNYKITVGGMYLTGLKAFKKAFRGAGIPKFILYMLCMPLVQFTVSSGMFMAPLLPVLRIIFKSVSSEAAAVAYLILQLTFIFVIISRCYTLHYLVLTDRSFPECSRKSREKISGKKLKMALSFLLWSLFILAVTVAATFAISFLVVLFIKGFSAPDTAFRTALKVLGYTINIFSAVSAFFSAPALMCWLTGRFFGDLEPNEKITLPDRDRKKMKPAPKAALIISLAVTGFVLNLTYMQAVYKGNVSLNIGITQRPQISAHRGFSAAAPENTVYAFEAALDSGADYIELDVQLTSDGELVVFHDKTLNRTTDGRGNLSSKTYAELQELSAGSWFNSSGEFDDAKIMLLSEVFELVGNDILLNIEIKSHGNYIAAAEKAVELIEEYDFESSCYVTSFSYPALKRVKELNPKIKTALTANVAASTSYSRLEYIDAVSLNYVFVNQSIVNTVHQNGKKIFVWTVDRNDDIKKMAALGVDNIITNRPDKAAEIVYSHNVGETILNALERIFGN